MSPTQPFHALPETIHSNVNIRAFSLVEVVIALAVFSFAMVSMAALIPRGLTAYQQAGTSTAEAQIIQNVMSQLELEGIANIPVPFTATNYYFTDQGLQTNQASALYSVTVNFSFLGSGGSGTTSALLDSLMTNAVYKVNIAVSSKSQTQTNTFSTFIAY